MRLTSHYKSALLFYSVAMKNYIIYLLLNLLFFIMMLALSIPCFFMFSRLLEDSRYYLIFLSLLIPLAHWFRKRLMRRRLLEFDTQFILFLKNLEQNSTGLSADSEIPPCQPAPMAISHIGGEFRKARKTLKEKGLKMIPWHSTLAAAALRLSETDVKGDHVFWRRLYAATLIKGLMVFTLISLPFVGVALLFTMGMNWAATLLVLSIGFFFSWFLYAAVAEPLLCLVTIRKAID